MSQVEKLLRAAIRDVPDFPKPGIQFKDITPVLADPTTFSTVVDSLVVGLGRGTVDHVVGIEARGFIIAAPVAYHMAAGFVPMRKSGKLPWKTRAETYDLEYGTETLEVHLDAIRHGERVAIVDDVLATGGTAAAAARLVESLGGRVVGFGFVIELDALRGRERLAGYDILSLVHF